MIRLPTVRAYLCTIVRTHVSHLRKARGRPRWMIRWIRSTRGGALRPRSQAEAALRA